MVRLLSPIVILELASGWRFARFELVKENGVYTTDGKANVRRRYVMPAYHLPARVGRHEKKVAGCAYLQDVYVASPSRSPHDRAKIEAHTSASLALSEVVSIRALHPLVLLSWERWGRYLISMNSPCVSLRALSLHDTCSGFSTTYTFNKAVPDITQRSLTTL